MPLFTSILALLLVIPTYGCTLSGLKEDVAVLASTSHLTGQILTESSAKKPVIVLLFKTAPGKANKVLSAHEIVYPDGEFHFMPAPGEYFILAFEDANGDLMLHPDEKVGWFGEPTAIVVSGDGAEINDIDIMLRPATEARRELPQLYAAEVPAIGIKTTSGYLHTGEVATIDHPGFSQTAGELGMWEPVKFLLQYGAGIYLLEPYDQGKIPLLFVHGVGGNPQNFRFLIEQLDRTRFQPVVVQYPSGLRLDLLSEILARQLLELRLRFGFTKLHIVAHSMGGLVAREMINRLPRQETVFLGTFVTLSSPWQGHPGARVGVEHSPAIIPCWYDMVPGSPFLQKLTRQPLPESVQYYLLFGYKGGTALFAGDANDGTLPLSSMADSGMQEVAHKVFAFNETHDSILTSPDVSLKIAHLLSGQPRPPFSGINE